MWQPIETAPKDGTVFLACVLMPVGWQNNVYHAEPTTDLHHYHVVMCSWGAGDRLNPAWWRNGSLPCDPTHWMPLPEKPPIDEAFKAYELIREEHKKAIEEFYTRDRLSL